MWLDANDDASTDTHNTKQPDFESAAAGDSPDDDTGDLPEEDEDPAATTRRLELERKRAEELARQAREKSIRDEADRKQKNTNQESWQVSFHVFSQTQKTFATSTVH